MNFAVSAAIIRSDFNFYREVNFETAIFHNELRTLGLLVVSAVCKLGRDLFGSNQLGR